MKPNLKPDAGFTAEQNRQIKAEINANKVVIDRAVFVKTTAEKLELKKLKKERLLSIGTEEHKSAVNELLKDFMKCDVPNYGSLVFNGNRIN